MRIYRWEDTKRFEEWVFVLVTAGETAETGKDTTRFVTLFDALFALDELTYGGIDTRWVVVPLVRRVFKSWWRGSHYGRKVTTAWAQGTLRALPTVRGAELQRLKDVVGRMAKNVGLDMREMVQRSEDEMRRGPLFDIRGIPEPPEWETTE